MFAALKARGQLEDTLVVYMGDNGFGFGEHGLIDKRNAYETSIRIPMVAWAPDWIAPGSTVQANVRNIDIAPTILELAGVTVESDRAYDSPVWDVSLRMAAGELALVRLERGDIVFCCSDG